MSRQKNHYPAFVLTAACMLLTGLSSATCAQSQNDSTPSVAEAARRAREKKKENAKSVRTLTNDDLPAATAGDAAAGSTSPVTPVNSEDTAAPAANAEQAKLLKADNAAALERAKQRLAQSLGELDIMQRKAALDSDSYYSKTDFASDTAGKAYLDSEAHDISKKKDDVEELKARVAELQALLDDASENESDKSEKTDKAEKSPPSR